MALQISVNPVWIIISSTFQITSLLYFKIQFVKNWFFYIPTHNLWPVSSYLRFNSNDKSKIFDSKDLVIQVTVTPQLSIPIRVTVYLLSLLPFLIVSTSLYIAYWNSLSYDITLIMSLSCLHLQCITIFLMHSEHICHLVRHVQPSLLASLSFMSSSLIYGCCSQAISPNSAIISYIHTLVMLCHSAALLSNATL